MIVVAGEALFSGVPAGDAEAIVHPDNVHIVHFMFTLRTS